MARRFGAAGDIIQLRGDRLTGARLLWQTFVTTGLPLSIEANEVLRGLLFGSDAILADVDALARARLRRLAQAVGDRITDIQNSGQPEPPELFAPTLFRLNLLIT